MIVSPETIAITSAIALAVFVFSIAIYRLYFHPLASIAGPFLQRISGIPRIWHCYTGDRHLHEYAAHQKYGPVARISPNAVAFSTLSGLQTIHAKDSNVFKGDEFYGLLDGGAEGGRSVQMTSDNASHAARRRVLDKGMPARDHAFQQLNGLAKLFTDVAFEKPPPGDDTDKGWSMPVNITPVSIWYTFDVISTIAFGKSLDMLRSEEYRWVPWCLRDTSIFLYWGGFATALLPFWQWLLGTDIPTWLRWGTVVETQKYGAFADEMVTKRAARMEESEKDGEGKASDIFQHLIRSGLYSDIDVRADSSLLIAAGSDAIRLTLAATIFYWLKNPAVFDKAKEEVRSSVTSTDDISDSTISSLRYLRACVDETMRLCPPKASSLPREVMEGGIVVDGVHVPKGATVGTSIYALHHDPEIYPDPYAYQPERWLEQPQDRRIQAAFCPFLKGPRACPGKTVAYFAIELALFHLVYRYDVRPAGGAVTGGGHAGLRKERRRLDEYQFHDWILGFADGPMVELKLRQ